MKLKYKKHHITSRYLKPGIAEIEFITEKFMDNDGNELQFEIKTSTFRTYYHISYMLFNKEEFHNTNGIHGNYHGYHFRDNYDNKFVDFEQVQKFMEEKYGFRLVKDGETIYHNY